MDDREKVIKGLEEISDYFFSVYHHSKDREEINKAKDRCDAVEDALALLKEQEAIKPKNDAFGHPCCPKCNVLAYRSWRFCPHCGQAVEWNDY